jgi:hypothetical protein
VAGRYFEVMSRGRRNFQQRRKESMKRDAITDAGPKPRIVFQSDDAEQGGRNTPSPEEIRKRAFEIHIERGGIHGCDLDDWLQAERELQEKYKNNERGPKNK